ncbi:hypothetical protein HanIR_Chr08g0388681 [Helianthus annuus]|nr:hypothetical protein HanIR_Chr08g0388681 [Helianthus annuus]
MWQGACTATRENLFDLAHDGLKPGVTRARTLNLGSGRTNLYCLYPSNMSLVEIELGFPKRTQILPTIRPQVMDTIITHPYFVIKHI